MEDAARPVPEKESDYPEAFMFDRRPLPAYGFYIRHADNVALENVRLLTQATGVLLAVLLALFLAFFTFGPGVCVWTFASEILPRPVRGEMERDGQSLL